MQDALMISFDLIAQLGDEPARFYSEERARMVRVQRNFIAIEYVELAVIIVSAIGALSQKNRSGPTDIALDL